METRDIAEKRFPHRDSQPYLAPLSLLALQVGIFLSQPLMRSPCLLVLNLREATLLQRLRSNYLKCPRWTSYLLIDSQCQMHKLLLTVNF